MNENVCLLPEMVGPCPRCGGRELKTVSPGAGAKNVLCRTCGACWHRKIQGIDRVDPERCPGCGFRKVCFAALAESSP